MVITGMITSFVFIFFISKINMESLKGNKLFIYLRDRKRIKLVCAEKPLNTGVLQIFTKLVC